MKRYLVLDTETTGVDEDARVVEIAWIELDEDLKEVHRIRSLIDPEMPIPPSAMGVHHITDEMVEAKPTLEEFFHQLKPIDLAPDDQVVLIAHNAQFDKRFIEDFLPVSDTLCTLRLSRYFWPDAPDHKLQTLRYHFKLGGKQGAHGALSDCETTLALLRHMTKSETLESLRLLCRGALPTRRMPFGKYRGELIEDVPGGYRAWLLGQDIDIDLWTALKASF